MGDENWANVDVWCNVLECHWLWTSTIVTRLERNSIVSFLTGEMDVRSTKCLNQFVSSTSLSEYFVLVGLRRSTSTSFSERLSRSGSSPPHAGGFLHWSDESDLHQTTISAVLGSIDRRFTFVIYVRDSLFVLLDWLGPLNRLTNHHRLSRQEQHRWSNGNKKSKTVTNESLRLAERCIRLCVRRKAMLFLMALRLLSLFFSHSKVDWIDSRGNRRDWFIWSNLHPQESIRWLSFLCLSIVFEPDDRSATILPTSSLEQHEVEVSQRIEIHRDKRQVFFEDLIYSKFATSIIRPWRVQEKKHTRLISSISLTKSRVIEPLFQLTRTATIKKSAREISLSIMLNWPTLIVSPTDE